MTEGLDYSQNIASLLGEEEGSDYHRIKVALINERASPELLHFQGDLMQRLGARVEQQEAFLNDTDGYTGVGDEELVRSLITFEMTRLRYMLRAYLRARARKIEKYVMHCINTPEVRSRLSPLEEEHAISYLKLVGNQLKRDVANKLPEGFSSVTRQAGSQEQANMIAAPDLGRHVFVKIERDLGQIQVHDDGSLHELFSGDVYIMQYSIAKHLLEDGAARLI